MKQKDLKTVRIPLEIYNLLKLHCDKKGYKIYMLSDIRSFGEDRDEKIVEENQNLQNHWITHINPVASLVKFRALYESEYITHLNGRILLQPWVGYSSTETRLIVDKPPKGKTYEYSKIKTSEFEDKLTHLNNIIKTYGYFKHPLPCSGYYYYDENELSISKSGVGLDHCWECTLECIIWCMYFGYDLDKFDGKQLTDFMKKYQKKILKKINLTTVIIHRPLNVNCHGMLPYLTSKEKYDYFTNFSNPKMKLFLERYTSKEKTKHCFNDVELY